MEQIIDETTTKQAQEALAFVTARRTQVVADMVTVLVRSIINRPQLSYRQTLLATTSYGAAFVATFNQHVEAIRKAEPKNRYANLKPIN